MKQLAFVFGALMAIGGVFADTANPAVKAAFASMQNSAVLGIPNWVFLLIGAGLVYWLIKRK